MVVLNFWYNYLEAIQFDLQMSIFDFDRQVAWFLMKYTPVLLNKQTNRSKKYASPHFLSQNFSGKQFWSKSEHFLNFWYQKSRNLAVEKKFFCDFSYHWAMRTNISKICDYCIFSEVFFRSAEQCWVPFNPATILSIIDHLPTCVDKLLTLKVDKNWQIWDYLPTPSCPCSYWMILRHMWYNRS